MFLFINSAICIFVDDCPLTVDPLRQEEFLIRLTNKIDVPWPELAEALKVETKRLRTLPRSHQGDNAKGVKVVLETFRKTGGGLYPEHKVGMQNRYNPYTIE